MFKFLYLPIIILFLSSCSADYKKLSKGNYSSDNPFYNTLINEYKKQADYEAKEMHDWNSAKLYSEKAIQSYEKKIIKPEPINKWNINDNEISELSKAYDNLMLVYKDGLNKDPVNLAKAIVSLDCWAEQQEEGWQFDHIENCKSRYLQAVHLLYENITEKSTVQESTKENDSVVVVTKKNKKIDKIIYFDFDHFKLNFENIIEIKKYISETNIDEYEYLIIGHTDSKGSKKYNYELSIKRANSVKELLNDLGISLKKMKIIGKGEDELAIQTIDEIAHPANRRVILQQSN